MAQYFLSGDLPPTHLEAAAQYAQTGSNSEAQTRNLCLALLSLPEYQLN